MSVCCAICLEPFNSDDQICSLPCGHIFHFVCMRNWCQIKKACPNCQIKIPVIVQRLYLNFINDTIVENESSECVQHNEMLEVQQKEIVKLKKIIAAERIQHEKNMFGMQMKQEKLERKVRKLKLKEKEQASEIQNIGNLNSKTMTLRSGKILKRN